MKYVKQTIHYHSLGIKKKQHQSINIRQQQEFLMKDFHQEDQKKFGTLLPKKQRITAATRKKIIMVLSDNIVNDLNGWGLSLKVKNFKIS